MIDDLHKPGSFGCHEALHMTLVCASFIDRELRNHPAILANSEWTNKVCIIINSLGELYNEIGAAHLTEDTDHDHD